MKSLELLFSAAAPLGSGMVTALTERMRRVGANIVVGQGATQADKMLSSIFMPEFQDMVLPKLRPPSPVYPSRILIARSVVSGFCSLVSSVDSWGKMGMT